MDISVIVPLYNEEVVLNKNCQIILDFLKKKYSSFELVLVNDGSKDKTEEIAESLAKK